MCSWYAVWDVCTITVKGSAADYDTFSVLMSLPALSLGDGLCANRKHGTGGGKWVHLEGENGMAISGLGCPLLQGWVGHLTCSYGCTEQFSHCAAPPVPVSIAHSDSSTRVHCLNRILVNEWVWLKSQIRLGPRMACLSKVKICLL